MRKYLLGNGGREGSPHAPRGASCPAHWDASPSPVGRRDVLTRSVELPSGPRVGSPRPLYSTFRSLTSVGFRTSNLGSSRRTTHAPLHPPRLASCCRARVRPAGPLRDSVADSTRSRSPGTSTPTDAAAKKRAAVKVNEAVKHLLSLKLADAGKSIDEARHALSSAEPAPADVRWADSL